MRCQAKQKGEVAHKGRPSVEFLDKQGNPVYYCMGYINVENDEMLETCKACRQNVIYAQEDYEKMVAKKAEK